MTLFLRSDGKAMWPTSRAAMLELERLPKGVPLKVDPKQPRNGRQHRLLWAFASLVADCLNDGPTAQAWDAEKVVTHLKLATGHVETVRLSKPDQRRLGVEFAALPKSISFAKMDGTEFSAFMDQAFIYVRDSLAPWIEQSDHWPDIAVILRESGLVSEDAA